MKWIAYQVSSPAGITLRFTPAGDFQRVCQAWHVASEVKVLIPGVRGAYG